MKQSYKLVLPDTHVPYHDKKAFELAVETAVKIGVDEVIIVGDFADFYAINRYGKHPKIQQTLMDEVIEVVEALEYISRKLPKAKKVFIEGNHEHRLSRFIAENAPAMFGVTDVKGILELKRLGWEYVPYGPNQAYRVPKTNLFLRHEPLAGGDNFLLGSIRKALCSIGFGHNHIYRAVAIKTLDGRTLKSFSVGWLGDLEKYPEIFNYVKTHHQWDLGFTVLTIDPNDPDGWSETFLRINKKDYSCRFGEAIFKL